jgi:N-carbamoylputrescine amidase
MRDLRVAAAIMQSQVGDPQGNLSRIHRFTKRAAALGARLVCFPEASITGYAFRLPLNHMAETVPGPLTDALQEMATENRITVLAGLIEKTERETFYLTHLVASSDGRLASYRKTHLGPPEREAFRPGEEIPIFHDQGAAFGIQLCYEGHFPELSTALALKGADILFFPHASPRGSPSQKAAKWMRYLPARAVDNAVFVVACNQTGRHPGGMSFPGVALILDPRGRVLARATGWEERLITADLKAQDLHRVRQHPMAYFLPHRRPDLYREGRGI